MRLCVGITSEELMVTPRAPHEPPPPASCSGRHVPTFKTMNASIFHRRPPKYGALIRPAPLFWYCDVFAKAIQSRCTKILVKKLTHYLIYIVAVKINMTQVMFHVLFLFSETHVPPILVVIVTWVNWPREATFEEATHLIGKASKYIWYFLEMF